MFAEASYAFDLAENADGGASSVALGRVSATDPEDSTITYSIEAGDSGGLFAIDSGTGALSYQGAGEDYESGAIRYELTVRASDGGLHSDVTVTVTVTDVQEAPAFGQENYAFSLTENAAGDTIGLSLGVVQATDPDDDPVDYSIEAGNPDGLFAIDATTGELSYQGAGEDYESGTTSYELTVRASDGTGHSDVVVTVNVADVADEEEYVALEQGITTDVSEPDDSDFPATTSTTGAVTVGGEVSGKIERGEDRDWFAVELEAGRTYLIDLEGSPTGAGTLWDPYLRGIHDADGDLIPGTTDNHYGAGRNSRLTFRAQDAGAYYVAAGAFGIEEGTYTLSVADVTGDVTGGVRGGRDDFLAWTGTSGAVEVDGSATGEIDSIGDRDWFAVTLDADKTYQIDLKGSYTGDGTLFNPYLRGIYDANGNFIALTTDDDDGAYANSRVFFTPEEAGVYYVAAGAHRAGEGTYTLSVAEVMDDFEAGTSGVVEVGGSVMGEIDSIGDRDWFAVTLEEGKNYQIDLKGLRTGDGTLRDPVLRGIHDTNGNFIPGTIDDDSGASVNSRVYFTAEETATYYVAAGAFLRYVGTYTLSVVEVPEDIAAGDRDDRRSGGGRLGEGPSRDRG